LPDRKDRRHQNFRFAAVEHREEQDHPPHCKGESQTEKFARNRQLHGDGRGEKQITHAKSITKWALAVNFCLLFVLILNGKP
jgi:hypothetical protein